MKLNTAEFLLMNNRIRALIQERVEFPRMKRHFELGFNKKILEIGCGNGQGAKIINKHYRPSQYIGIDLDERMISIAKRKNLEKNVSFIVANAASLPFEDTSFDAVFDFGVIHHLSDWTDCVKEVFRVLKNGGLFIVEDLSLESFSSSSFGTVWRKLTDHPYGSMYQRQEFMDHLKASGFSCRHSAKYNFMGVLKYFVVIASK